MDTGLRHWFERIGRAFLPSELQRLDEQYLEELAREVGVTPPQLIALEAAGDAAASQLPRRLATLQLDENAVEARDWAALRDMQRLCSLCGSKAQCEHDLDNRADDPEWENYCPNAATIRNLAGR